MKKSLYTFYKKLADSDLQTLRATREEFESILGMNVEDEIFTSLYINARYLPGYKTFILPEIGPLFIKSKFRLPLATNFLYKKFSRKVTPNPKYKHIVDQIDKEGYYVVENFLSADQVEKVREDFARFEFSSGNYGTKKNLKELRAMGDRLVTDVEAPSRFHTSCVGYTLDPASPIGRLLVDPFMADICASYFQCQPYFTRVVNMFTLPRDPGLYSDAHVHASAQTWHFDYSDFKFLKFFLYLTDVSPDNGPHTFAAGTHEERLLYPNRAEDFHKGGFMVWPNGAMSGRIKDEWVNANLDPKRILAFAKPKGTLIIENTSGLHKGGDCVRGSREVMVCDYAISNMSGPYELPILDHDMEFPYDSHLMTVLKGLHQDQIDKYEAFKKRYTIKQRIKGKIITTFRLKGITVD